MPGLKGEVKFIIAASRSYMWKTLKPVCPITPLCNVVDKYVERISEGRKMRAIFCFTCRLLRL